MKSLPVIVSTVLPHNCGPDPNAAAENLYGTAIKEQAIGAIQKYGCSSCQTIPGVPGAEANVGPPLTKVALRTYLAGRIANDDDNLLRWIQHPNPLTRIPPCRN